MIARHFAHFLVLSFSLCSLFGNSDTRDWTLNSDKTLHAELVSYDPETGQVLLKFNDLEDSVFRFEDFSIIDQAWLVEWVEFEAQLHLQVAEMGGQFEHLVTKGNYPTELFVYYPTSAQIATKPLPAMILFHPGGKAARYCLRHMEAAETSGMILIACGSFRNTGDDFLQESAMLARFKDIFPEILERVRLDPKRIFMGGTSGGAWKAFHYSAWVKYPWAGIYSNVGWLGGKKYYNLPYPGGMRVAIVNGNQDRAANGVVNADSALLQKAGNKVAVMMFEGAHQVPPVDAQIKAFNWLLENEDFEEL